MINKTSIQIAFVALGSLLFLAGLGTWMMQSFLSAVLPILYLSAGLILLSEVGFQKVLSSRVTSLEPIKMFGLILGVLSTLAGLLMILSIFVPSVSVGWITLASGIPVMVLGGMIFAEAFLIR